MEFFRFGVISLNFQLELLADTTNEVSSAVNDSYQ